MMSGTVKWFDDLRGFGFIARDDGGDDLLCDYSAILADGCFRKLAEGQKVEFELGAAASGPVAVNVRRVFDERGTLVTVLCADAVQVRVQAWGRPNLRRLADRARSFGDVRHNDLVLRLRAPPHELTVFDDGRAIVKGTGDADVARALLSRWLGVRVPAE